MNAFVNAVKTTPIVARTDNGMKAQESSMSSVVDLFYHIGASRRSNIVPLFDAAFAENADLALRIAQYARDIRGGQGERKGFRDILGYLETNQPSVLLHTKFMKNIPEIGRWDDLLVFTNPKVKEAAFRMISDALLVNGNGLCAKWMPRKGTIAVELRNYLGLSPKEYRRTLVRLTNVVETKMCAKNWEDINYSHVPSLAMARYMTAFHKNDAVRFQSYKDSLVKGETKVNASAVYPYDIIKAIRRNTDATVAEKMWDALPNYIGDANILPVVDVSGSMDTVVAGTVTALDVSLSLGLYCATKNKGAFKDIFMTFSGVSRLEKLKGTNLKSKMTNLSKAHWAMNTNISAAFDNILTFAVDNAVPQEDMPNTLLILSDMQFDMCADYDDSAMKMIRRKYEKAGYNVPVIVFWNINSNKKSVPVSFNEKGVALVSGFSPSIMKSVLSMSLANINPLETVKEAVLQDRYNYL